MTDHVHAEKLDPSVYSCALHNTHSPVPWTLDNHHVVLHAWTLFLGLPPGQMIPVCPTGHDAIHQAIRLLIEGKPLPHRMPSAMAGYVQTAVDFWNAHPELAAGGVGFVA